MTRALHALVRGRVQGVGFRWSTQRRATELGLAGWVRNKSDGCVELHAEGDDEALESFFAWLQRGPRLARVESVEVESTAVSGASVFEATADV